MSSEPVFAIINYEDPYVQPLLWSILHEQVPQRLLNTVPRVSDLPSDSTRLLQWVQYEGIDFDHLMSNPQSSMSNSYVIRKALIRKHYLCMTVSHWITKNPESPLKHHVKPSVEFEVDYAEFLDDALVEAFELKDSWAKNEALPSDSNSREWWILKPGMSDRGQGIRLFSSEEELQHIFEEWDPPSDDEDEDEDAAASSVNGTSTTGDSPKHDASGNGVVTSHLRHFVAQPYISDPLLIPAPHPSHGRKFHIRTYVCAVGALKVYVSKPMLALFAAQPYTDPSSSLSSAVASAHSSSSPNDDLSRHLTNTCLQSGEREGSVHAFWSLPADIIPGLPASDWRQSVFEQICAITGEVFEGAARSMSIHFQPLPNAFEIFGLDFLVDARGTAWLLEVNAFPDFAQTGPELRVLIEDLFRDVVDVAVKPFFGLDNGIDKAKGDGSRMVKVLDIDLGRK